MADSWVLVGVRGGSPAGGGAADVVHSRFSLLDLDPGEIYFQDFSVTLNRKEMTKTGATAVRRTNSQLKGRLKICSKSFLFDPADVARPMIKFPLRYVDGVNAIESSADFDWVGAKAGTSLVIRARTTVEIKERNVVGPFVFKKHDENGLGAEAFLVTFHYVGVEAALPLMSSLLSASQASFSRQSEIVESIQSRQAEVKFNRNWLDDAFDAILLQLKAERISPLVVNPGRVVLTGSKLYFQPFNNVEPFPCLHLTLRHVSQIVKRRYLLRHVGLEITCRAPASGGVTNFLESGGGGVSGRGGAFATSTLMHVYLVCEDRDSRDRLYDAIIARDDVRPDDDAQQAITLKWQNGVLTNFDYLMGLNNLANRSMSDLTQYPVFPWVLRDYTSKDLDLNNPDVFRDLTKPVGALNEERLRRLKQRFQDMPEPRFLYGSHYSTPGFVLFYLVRAAPELMLCLQNGRFDLPDRMFNGIAEAWHNVLTNNSDFKELIPEFYMTADEGDDQSSGTPSLIAPLGGLAGNFLTNYRGIDFGTRQATGKSVREVELPPWARTHGDFVAKMREALESEYVSKNLHHWIDLVFGYKQRGQEAREADNLFHYLTYEGSVDIEAEIDPAQRAALEAQILEFGQTPTQLFTYPHPQRAAVANSLGTAGDLTLADAAAAADGNGGVARYRSRGFSSLKNSEEEKAGADIPLKNLLAQPKILRKIHRDVVTGIEFSRDGKRVVTISKDGFLKVNCLEKGKQLVSFSISGLPLTCLQLLPDGDSALIGSSDNNVYLFNLVQCVATQPMDYAHDDSITDVCWRNDVLLTCSSDCSAKLWSLPWNRERGNHPDVVLLAILDHDHPVYTGTLTDDAAIVATGTEAGDIYLWNVDDPSSPSSVLDEFHDSSITRFCFDPHSTHQSLKLASCSQDGVISVIDVSTGTRVFVARETAQGRPDPLTFIAWVSDDDKNDRYDDDEANRNNDIVLSSEGNRDSRDGDAVSFRRGRLAGLYCGKGSGELDVWDMVEGRRRDRLINETSPVSCLDVTASVGIAAGYRDGTVVLWLLKR